MTFNTSLLSKYRTELMGVAILWVFLFHCQGFYKNPLNPLWYVMAMGFGGVDIFLFLSGMGLCFSYTRKPRLGSFYGRRMVRIFPAFIVVTFFGTLLTSVFNWSNFLLTITTLGFWLDISNNWYIPALVLFYLAFPALYPLVRKRPVSSVIGAFLLSWALLFAYDYFGCTGLSRLAITRIPVFVLGMATAARAQQATELKGKSFAALFIAFFVGIALEGLCTRSKVWAWDRGLIWYAMFLVVPFLMLVLCKGFSRLSPKSVLLAFLRLNGRLSLEIYLILLYVLTVGDVYAARLGINLTLFFVLAYVVIFDVSYVLHRLLGRLQALLLRS